MVTYSIGRTEKMVMALAVWLCGLPIAFGVAVLISPQAGLATALGMLILTTAMCWAICGARFALRRKNDRRNR